MKLDSQVHHQLIRHLIDEGHAPGSLEIAEALGVEAQDVDRSLRRLAEGHGLVLHPHRVEPWVVHPFSLSPTGTWVQGREHGWWAPCMWCALGITSLIDGKATIHTRLGGETEPIQIVVDDERLIPDDLIVHFAIPVADAWDNVHHFCSTVLPFRSVSEVQLWCRRHAYAEGRAIPLAQANALARAWYGCHADVEWVKWTPAQAAEIFRSVGLDDAFWQVPQGDETF